MKREHRHGMDLTLYVKCQIDRKGILWPGREGTLLHGCPLLGNKSDIHRYSSVSGQPPSSKDGTKPKPGKVTSLSPPLTTRGCG